MKHRIFSVLLCLLLVSVLALPVAANESLPRIVDNADLLNAEEETQLEELALSFRVENNLDAVVLTVNSLDGNDIATYADNYYEHSGYGIGAEYSGLILVVAMEERELYISTSGEAILRLNDYELDTIIEDVSSWLSDGEYYDAFDTFFWVTPLYLDLNSEANGEPEVVWLLSILSGAVVAGIAVLIMRGSMNTKRKQHSAGDYVREGSYDLKNRQDIFLYSNVSKVKREQNKSSGGGGGTSVHRSSSGRSHGGRGGKF